MKRFITVALAAGTALVAVPTPALAAGWQPASGSVTVDAVNPCTGETTDFTFVWSESRTSTTGSGGIASSYRGTYTATDGSTGSVRVSTGSSTTKDGYTDSYRRQGVGDFEGRTQRLAFVFRVVVGESVDVKVQRDGSSCSG
ncbi:hypothetical protein [Oryzobacter telluris]|uniref:hypothetical protein n=1 Tax=Oryzobacter telluris TaxID=3149179 RepID=UPI00370D8C7F